MSHNIEGLHLERGILREAKMGKKLLQVPLWEITLAPKVTDGDLQRRHENEIEVRHCAMTKFFFYEIV